MKLSGEYRFDAPAQDLWQALFDPAVLAAAMPGCEKLELVGDDLVGEMTIKVGPISGKFTGKVRLEDKVEPTSYRMIVDGKGAPGFVKATVTITLTPDGAQTKLAYDGDAQVGGKIASVGERLIDASAKAITKQSLDNLHENVKIRAAHQAQQAQKLEQAAQTKQAETADRSPTEDASAPPVAAPVIRAAPVYKQADAAEMAKAVTTAAAKTMWPVVVAVVAVIAAVVYLLVR